MGLRSKLILFFLSLGVLSLLATFVSQPGMGTAAKGSWALEKELLQTKLSKSSKAKAILPTSTPYTFERYLNSTVLKPGDAWGFWGAFPATLFQLDGVASGTQRQFELAPLQQGCYDLELEWWMGEKVSEFSFHLIDRVGRPVHFERRRTGKLSLHLLPSIYRIEVAYAGTITRDSSFALRASKVAGCRPDAAGWGGSVPDVSRYQIRMSPMAANSFEMARHDNEKRLLGVGAGSIIDATNVKVTAEIWQDDHKTPSKVRMWPAGVGDLDHFDKHHPSLTVEVVGGPLLQGMRKFKLYNFRSANGYLDYTTTGLAALEGLMVPRQRLVSVSFDGREAGLYVIMELPSKEFQFGTRRHDGEILSLRGKDGKMPYLPGYGHADMAIRELAHIDSSQMARFSSYATRFNGTHGMNPTDTRFYRDRLLPSAAPIMRDVNINYWADNGLALRSFLSHASWWLIDRFFPIEGPHVTPLVRHAGNEQIECKECAAYFMNDNTLGVQGTHPSLAMDLLDFTSRSYFERYLMYYALDRDFASRFVHTTENLNAIAKPLLSLDPLGLPQDLEGRVADPFSGEDVSVAKAVPRLVKKARLLVIPGEREERGRRRIFLYNFSAFSMQIPENLVPGSRKKSETLLGLGPARLYAYLENDIDGAVGTPPLGRMTPRVAKTAAMAELALQKPATPGLQVGPLGAVAELSIPEGRVHELLAALRAKGKIILAGGLALPPESVVGLEQLPAEGQLQYFPGVNRNGDTYHLEDLLPGLVLLPAGQFPTSDGMVLRYLVTNQSDQEATIRLEPLLAARWNDGESMSTMNVDSVTYRAIGAKDAALKKGEIVLPGMKPGPARQGSGLFVDGMAALLNGSYSPPDTPTLALLEFLVKRDPDASVRSLASNSRTQLPPLLAAIRQATLPIGLPIISHEPAAWFSSIGEPQKTDDTPLDYSGMDDQNPVLGSGRIDSVLVFGRHQTLRINPGARIEFGPDGGLLIFGRMEALGTEQAPIIMKPAGTAWRGMAVVNAHTAEHAPSRMHHMSIEGIRRAPLGPVAKLGGVQFVRSTVEMKHVVLKNLDTEDGISFYKSYFELEDVSLSNAADDCIDIDWSWGKFNRVVISGCGGDGIDLNNTLAEMRGIQISAYKDKGISVGEASIATVSDARLEGGSVGAAIKDLSSLSLGDGVNSINHTDGDIALYVKNATFGRGAVRFLGQDVKERNRLRVIDHGDVVVAEK